MLHIDQIRHDVEHEFHGELGRQRNAEKELQKFGAADEPREATGGGKERVVFLAHDCLIGGPSSSGFGEKTFRNMTARFERVVDAFPVKGIHKAGSIANNNPTGTAAVLNMHWKPPRLWTSDELTKTPRVAHLSGVGIEHGVEIEIRKVLHRR